MLSENSSVKIGGIYSSDAVYKNLEISDRFLAERNTILEFASVLLDIFTPISHSSSGKIHIDPNEQKQYEDVKKLITDCKREDSRSRPSFDDLLNKFEDILFGTKSSHTNNRLLWESINKNWVIFKNNNNRILTFFFRKLLGKYYGDNLWLLAQLILVEANIALMKAFLKNYYVRIST